jgi:hypothetical protein
MRNDDDGKRLRSNTNFRTDDRRTTNGVANEVSLRTASCTRTYFQYVGT